MSLTTGGDSVRQDDLLALGLFALLVSIYLTAFLLFYIAVRQLAPGRIIYYSSVGALLAATGANALGTLLVARGKPRLRLALVVPALVTSLLAGYAFIITVPSLLDRSISHFVIGTLAGAGPTGADMEFLQRTFVDRYVEGTAAVEKRLEEQIASGNVVRDGARYRLTPRGRATHRAAVWLARLLNVTEQYVNPLGARE